MRVISNEVRDPSLIPFSKEVTKSAKFYEFFVAFVLSWERLCRSCQTCANVILSGRLCENFSEPFDRAQGERISTQFQ